MLPTTLAGALKSSNVHGSREIDVQDPTETVDGKRKGTYPAAICALESPQVSLIVRTLRVILKPEGLQLCNNWITDKRFTLYGEVFRGGINVLLAVSQDYQRRQLTCDTLCASLMCFIILSRRAKP
jgi:hypothetical protein